MQTLGRAAMDGLSAYLAGREPTGSQRTHIDAGEAALVRIRQTAKQTFSDWLAVGHALCDLQELALNLSGSNQPVGKAYNAAYAGLISPTPQLGDLDKGTVSRARWLYVNRDAVEEWHGNLHANERTEINHPRVVKARYEAYLRDQEKDAEEADGEPKQAKPKKPSPADLLNAENNRLRAELEQAHRYITELHSEVARLESENKSLFAKVDALEKQIAAKPDPAVPKANGSGRPRKTPKSRGGAKSKYPFADLKIGQSFVVDRPQQKIAPLAWAYGKRHQRTFSTKKLDSGTEVTRVA